MFWKRSAMGEQGREVYDKFMKKLVEISWKFR